MRLGQRSKPWSDGPTLIPPHHPSSITGLRCKPASFRRVGVSRPLFRWRRSHPGAMGSGGMIRVIGRDPNRALEQGRAGLAGEAAHKVRDLRSGSGISLEPLQRLLLDCVEQMLRVFRGPLHLPHLAPAWANFISIIPRRAPAVGAAPLTEKVIYNDMVRARDPSVPHPPLLARSRRTYKLDTSALSSRPLGFL